MSVCTNHTETATTLSCAGCSKAFCENCLVPFEKLHLCASCKTTYLGANLEPRAQATTRTPTGTGAAAATRKSRPMKKKTIAPFAIGIGLLVFVFAFVFVVVTRLANPILEERRAETLAEALQQISEIGAALEAYRVETGDFPAQLADLVPDFLPSVPDDPYGSGPPKYKHSEERVLLYSVGPNGKDDEGAPYQADRRRGDILYRAR